MSNRTSSKPLPAGFCPAPGTVVSIPIGLGLRHLGMVSDRMIGGRPTILSSSNQQGCLVEEPWDQFDPHGAATIEPLTGPASGLQAVARMRSLMGTPYSWLNRNCEHVIHEALGLEICSPQLQTAAILAVVIGFVWFAASGKLKAS